MTREYREYAKSRIEYLLKISSFVFDEHDREALEVAKQALSQEPKSGKWIAQDIHNCHTDFRCSECGYIHSFMHLYGEPTADYTYCPNCGAKMESEDKE